MVCKTCNGWGAIKRPRRLFVDHNDEKIQLPACVDLCPDCVKRIELDYQMAVLLGQFDI